MTDSTFRKYSWIKFLKVSNKVQLQLIPQENRHAQIIFSKKPSNVAYKANIFLIVIFWEFGPKK